MASRVKAPSPEPRHESPPRSLGIKIPLGTELFREHFLLVWDAPDGKEESLEDG